VPKVIAKKTLLMARTFYLKLIYYDKAEDNFGFN